MNNTITLSATQLKNLLEVHQKRKEQDNSVSDFIQIKLIRSTDIHNESDKVVFDAQSIFGECNNHFLGTN